MARAESNDVKEVIEVKSPAEASEEVVEFEAETVSEVESPVDESAMDDAARLDDLIAIHRSLAHTRGENQEFEFAGKKYTVFQDGVVSIDDA